MAGLRLSADEAALWSRVMATVTPLAGAKPIELDVDHRMRTARSSKPTTAPNNPMPVKKAGLMAAKAQIPGHTLDGGWDRRLARGTIDPDATVDLHGHTLATAHALLDQAIARSRARGDRVILLITGKPPRPDSERPHARGAIRSAVGDWLRASRHAADIAAVRGAAPRHGGSGALYIILRRPRVAPTS